MKKLITWFLVFAMCLSMFAGCKQEQVTPTTEPVGEVEPTEAVNLGDPDGLANALEYLRTIYKEAGGPTPKDYTRIGTVPVGVTKYEVVWTTSLGEDLIQVVRGEDGMVTIKIVGTVEVDTPYTLTATITDAAGNSVSHSWEHILPAAMDMVAIVKEAYGLANGESLPYEATLTGKIISIDTAWNPEYQNITVTIAVEGAEDMPIQCYRLQGDGADSLVVGNIITVTGTLKNYSGTIEFDAGCILEYVEKGDAVEALTDPLEILKAAYKLKDGESLGYNSTLTGVVTQINTPYDSGYKNITVTMVVEGQTSKPIMCYRLKGSEADKIAKGDTITVSGMIKNYKGTIEFDAGCQLISRVSGGGTVATDPGVDTQVVDEAYRLGAGEALEYIATLRGTVISVDTEYSSQYGNVTVTIVVSGRENKPIKCYRMKGDAAPIVGVNDVIDVTGIIKNYVHTSGDTEVEFDAGCTGVMVKNNPDPEGPAEPDTETLSIPEAVELGESMSHNQYTKSKYYVTGVITEVYNTTYGNMYIEDENGNTLTVYGTYDATGKNRYDAMSPKPVAGDTVTVYGVIGQYGGTAQMKNGWIVEINGEAGGNEGGNEGGEEEDKPVYDDVVTMVDAPEAGTAYKLLMDQKTTGELLYFNGKTESESITYRLATTTDAAKAVDVYLEEVTGGYLLYFMDGETKTYIRVFHRTDGDPGYGKGSLELVTAAPSEVFTYNATAKTLVYDYDGNNAYYMGTYSTYTTVSVSNTSYITGDKAETVDVSQFPVRFATVELAEREEVTLESIAISGKTEYTVGNVLNLTVTATYSDGSTEEVEAELSGYNMSVAGTYTVTATYEGKTATIEITVKEAQTDTEEEIPYEVGKAYKLMMDQKANGTKLYFNGQTESASVTYRLATTENVAEAVDVYLEEVAGGYQLYFMNGETKTYIRVFHRTDGDPGYGKGSLELVTAVPAEVLSYYEAADTFIHDYDGNNAYYMGTYSTYVTISVSNTSYITGDNAANVDVSQFPARLVEVEGGEEGGETPVVTLESIAISGTAEYTVGDALALVVTATYSDGSTKDVTAEATLSGYDMSVAGTYTVTATYEGKTATIEITVKEAQSDTEEEIPYEIGKAYKLMMDQKANGTKLYFNGQTESASVTYRLATTENVAEAVDVYLEEVEGGYALYFMNGETKTYIRVFHRTDGNPGYGKGSLELVTAAPAEALSYFEDADTFIYDYDGNNAYYMGTYSTYVTISVSNTSYITGNNAANVDVSQFPARLVEVEGGEEGGETPVVTLESIAISGTAEYTVGDALALVVTATYSDGSTKDVTAEATLTGYDMSVAGTYTVTATYEGKTATIEITVKEAQSDTEEEIPYEIGKAYKLMMDQKANGTKLYFNGQTESASVTYRLATTENVAEAVDVYLEEVEGGYALYFMNGETKTYIRVYHRTDGNPGYGKGSLELVTAAPVEALSYFEDADTFIYDYDGNNAYYMGTYSTYVTISVSNTSYITGNNAANVDVSQFPARLVEVEGGEEGGETPVVTLESIAISGTAEYTVGDALALVVTATYSDGSTKDVTAEATLAGYDMSVAGTYTVTATYEGKTATFEITVKADESGEEGGETEATAVTITFDDAAKRTTSTTTEQVWEENGITFTYEKGSYTNNLAEYANPIRCYQGTSIEIAYESMVKIEFTCGSESYATALKNSISDTVTVDGNVVTVELTEAVDSYKIAALSAQVRIKSITVYSTAVTEGEGGETTEVTLTGITVTGPAKVKYTVGEEFDATGLVVTATYSDGSTKDVTAEATLSGYDMGTAGEQTVTVTYEDKTATFIITVKEAEGGETETVPTYKKVTSEDDFTTGTYVVVVSGKMVTTLSGSWVLVDDFTATGDTITGEFSTWTITVDGTSAVLTDANGVSIAPKGGNTNGIASGEYSWAWSYSDDAFTFAGTGSDTVILTANAQQGNKLRAYKTTTVSGNPTGYPSNFTLYKLVTE